MADLAALAVGFDPTAINEGRRALEAIIPAAQKVEKAASDVSKATAGIAKASDQSAQKVVALSKAAERTAAALAKAEKSIVAEERAIARMGGSSTQAAAGLMRIEAAAEAAAEEVQRLSTASVGAGVGLGTLGAGLGRASQQAAAANSNLKLTSNQVQNLGYQLNDVATMLAMGASPFQILASQGGQIVQALGDGPGGVTGSLKAMGAGIMRLATPTNLVIGALTAAAGAAIYFAVQSQKRIKPVSEAMEEHAASIKAVAAAYDVAIDANTRYTSLPQAAFASRRSEAQLRLSARTSMFDNGFAGGSGSDFLRMGRTDDGGRTHQVRSGYEAFAELLIRNAEKLRAGTEDARELIDGIARIAETDPNNEDMQKKAQAIIDLAQPAADAAEQIDQLAKAMSRVREMRISEATDSFKEFLPNTKTTAETINERYQARIAAIGSLPASQRGASEGMRIAAANDLKKALEELDRFEANRRAGYELDLKAIGARTAGDKAAIAAERERLALADVNISSAEKERRIEEARTLSLTESSSAITEATRQRIASGQANVDQMEFELGLVGKSTAETARLRAEFDMLTAAKEAARAAGTVVDPTEEKTIKDQAARIGELTAATQKLNFEREVQFRLQQAGRSPEDQRLAQEVRQYGEDITTANGQAMAAQLRYVASVEKTAEQLQDMREVGKDAFLDIIDAMGSGEDAGKSFISVLANIGRQMAGLGAEKLFDALTGKAGNDNTAGGLSGIFGAISQVAKPKTATEIFGGGQTFADAPTIAVERAVLPALTKASSSMTAAAAAIRTIESGSAAGNYGAVGPVTSSGDRAYGAYQVMGNNIASWSKAALGQSISIKEFVSNAAAQDKIFQNQFGRYMEKYGPEGASRAWFAGEGGMKNFAGKDIVGTSVGGYGSRFGQLYAKHSGANDNTVQAAAVSKGLEDYARQASSGGAPNLLGSFGGFSSAWQSVSGTGPTAGIDPWNSGGINLRQTSGGGGSIMGSGGLQIGMSAIGSAAAGYQSGNAWSGAAQGFMAGLSTGNPVAAVIGAIAGGAGGCKTKSKHSREKQAALDASRAAAWENMEIAA